MMKKISIVGTVGLPPSYGGFETLADNLVRRLGTSFDLTVVCSGRFYKRKVARYCDANLKYINLSANGIQSVLYDVASIVWSLTFADTILVLGVSGAIVLPAIRIFSKKRIIVNIDGLEWKRQKWGLVARQFLKFSERLAVRYADVVVSDNKVIQDYVKHEYGTDSALIAYGGDHITQLQLSRTTIEQYPFLSKEYALNISRIEPENNIHLILAAFEQHNVMDLVVLGDWDANPYGRQLKERFGRIENIHLLGPMYDNVDVKSQIRSNCAIYVHGHSAGGTSPSLVEAMNMGKPVIAYSVGYNSATTEDKALYFSDSAELGVNLDGLTKTRREAVGCDMREIAKRRYTWDKISKEYASLF